MLVNNLFITCSGITNPNYQSGLQYLAVQQEIPVYLSQSALLFLPKENKANAPKRYFLNM